MYRHIWSGHILVLYKTLESTEDPCRAWNRGKRCTDKRPRRVRMTSGETSQHLKRLNTYNLALPKTSQHLKRHKKLASHWSLHGVVYRFGRSPHIVHPCKHYNKQILVSSCTLRPWVIATLHEGFLLSKSNNESTHISAVQETLGEHSGQGQAWSDRPTKTKERGSACKKVHRCEGCMWRISLTYQCTFLQANMCTLL